jgi:Rieske Fe-S protein
VLWNADADSLDCPCHEGRFDPRDGQVVAGPPPRALAAIELAERTDGIYAVGISEVGDGDA